MKGKIRLLILFLFMAVIGTFGYSISSEAAGSDITHQCKITYVRNGGSIIDKITVNVDRKGNITDSDGNLIGYDGILDIDEKYFNKYVNKIKKDTDRYILMGYVCANGRDNFSGPDINIHYDRHKIAFSKTSNAYDAKNEISVRVDTHRDSDVTIHCFNLKLEYAGLEMLLMRDTITGAYGTSSPVIPNQQGSQKSYLCKVTYNELWGGVTPLYINNSTSDVDIISEQCIGYTFKGWAVGYGIGEPINYSRLSVKEVYRTFFNNFPTEKFRSIGDISRGQYNKTVHMIPTFDETAYSISYNLDGGTSDVNLPPRYNLRSDIALKSPKKKGYKCLGWYDSYTNQPITYIKYGTTINGQPILRNLTLNAKWEKIPYTLSYELNGGEVEEGTTFIENYDVESAVEIPVPTKEGYTFDGWFDNKEYDGEAIESLPVGSTGNKTLYAKFSPIEYAINYELNEGENPEEQPLTHNAISKKWLLEPVKEGYVFDGWYYEEDFSGDKILGIEPGRAEDVTVYAKWVSEEEIEAQKQAEKDAIIKAREEKAQAEYDAKEEKTLPVTDDDYEEKEVVNSVKVAEYKGKEPEEVNSGEIINSAKTKKVKFVTAKNKKGNKLKITWKLCKGYNYEVQYSTSSKFKKSVTKSKNTSKGNIVIGKLKRGIKYYVRVRTFKTVNGTTVYGKWSVPKVVKIKK